jgi:hypothetical protein
MALKLKRQDQAEVLEALQEGEYEAITTSGQGALDELVHLAIELGIFEALEVIQVERERAGIPDELLLRVLAVLPFVEAMGLSASAGYLLRDAAILLRLGFTIQQLQDGFNERHRGEEGKSEDGKPCHPEVLREELARIDPASLAAFRKRVVKELFERGLVKGRVCAIDGTGLKDRHTLVGVMTVHEERSLWLNWRLLDGDASEKGQDGYIVREMVGEIIDAGGPDAIEWLIMDALYADGPLLAWLEYGCGIHALVRLPQDRKIYRDLEGMAEGGLLDWTTRTDVRYVAGRKQARRVSIAVDDNLALWDSFQDTAAQYGAEDAVLWGALIRAVDVDDPADEETFAIVSTHPFTTGWAGYRQWRLRWRVENTGFRELKEGWHLERAPWSYTNDTVVAARVAFTLLAFNIAQIAKTAQGRCLTDRGIRRLRRELGTRYGLAPVIVFTEDAFGVFHIEEVMEALGSAPAFSLRPQPSIS